MNGDVNSQNVRQYALVGEPSNFHYHRPDSTHKLTVWAGCCGNGEFLGPFFIGGNLNRKTYLEPINDEIISQLTEIFANHFDKGSF